MTRYFMARNSRGELLTRYAVDGKLVDGFTRRHKRYFPAHDLEERSTPFSAGLRVTTIH